ncbi:MAG: TraM recognition domain-containing protein [Gordonia sp. (in: high G+C Gram-positive bacteria)]|uniref:type IV secretory system conjugative DNA transfer family protein n=1 Tax=Gordonia sp. (in: high G+C Gram-positive bacteria) TaxID=84139 RepID=UPI003BB58AD7
MIGLLLVVWLAWVIGSAVVGKTGHIDGPPTGLLGLVTGENEWPWSAWIALILLVAALATGGWKLWQHGPWTSTSDTVIKEKTSVLASAKETSGITLADARRSTQRLWPDADLDDEDQCGMRVGMMMDRRNPVVIPWEWVATVLAGPRSGKTLAFAIPQVLRAPGACVATSNKPDLWAATALARSDHGTAWLSDLQRISTRPGQDWWWNPLRGVDSQAGALRVASYFVSASREDNQRTDAYFDGGAQALLALMMLAAAVSGGDLWHVYGWLAEPERELPSELLITAGEPMAAERLRTARALNPRQRDGLYDMARRFISVLEEPVYACSVLPPERHSYGDSDSTIGRVPRPKPCVGPEFIADEFVLSTDTLYALSMEGPDAATPLTTALIGTVFDSAVKCARSYGGRLPTPMVAVLDEAANVCKLKDLPSWYSHFGSQGICVWTFIQSLPQAIDVWGETGTDKLISASNLHIYAGGALDLGRSTYLADLSRMIGVHDVARWNKSVNEGSSLFSHHGAQQSWSTESVFTADELAALNSTLAIAITSGNSPILLRKEWVTDEDHPLHETVQRSKADVRLDRLVPSPAQREVLATATPERKALS